jgi:chorismate mutase/prephenate dehydratase
MEHRDLSEIRAEILEIDDKMAALFEKRMKLAANVMDIKKELGLPVSDPEREKKVLQRAMDSVQDINIKEYYKLLTVRMMELSRDYQNRLQGGMRVGYSGLPGAYAYNTARRLYPSAQLIAYPDFESAYQACVDGDVESVALPMENSYAGDVGNVLDLAYTGELFINIMAEYKIEHYLLGVKGAQTTGIKKVVSHPQALSQCGDFIRIHKLATVPSWNTAAAAKEVADKGDPTVAAIASKENAELYGLDILEKGINTSPVNATRFAIFSRIQNKLPENERNHFFLIFTVRNECGALANVLNLIGAQGFNMSNLRSRPIKGAMWGHSFFAELDGDAESPEGKDLITQMKAICDRLIIAGNYKSVVL